MAGVIQKPDSLSLSGNIKKFVLTGNQPVSFVLKKGDTVLLESEYIPGSDNLLDIDVKDVVESCLSYNLNASTDAYVQTTLVGDFVATIDNTDYPFRVIRAGVAHLADTAANWLKLHFLTWQPRVKQVTYYSPEWLTYYAIETCAVKLKANYPDKSTKIIHLHDAVGGTARTINLQYAVVAGKLGNTYPSFYEVWVEKSDGTKLSESQFYAFSDVLSEDEQWYLFENSLGGLDTFRAYGTNNLNAEHEHNIAELGDIREEYQVGTERKYTKNTGYLDEYSRRWLLDFFPSRAKYVYEASAIRKIVVTESNVTYVSNELPSNYTFTWQLAEVSALLNLVKNETDIPDNLVAPDLTSPDFSLPPRLAEFPRITLSEGVLIPAFDPFNPKPTVTTYGAIHNTIKNAVVKELEEELAGIGGGGGNPNPGPVLEIIESTDYETIPTDENLYSALKAKLEDDRIKEESDSKYLRKDQPDKTDYLLGLNGGATFGNYVGGFLGSGGKFDDKGDIEGRSLVLREFLEVPELRFNRIDVVSGELWNSIAFGLIEEVDEVNKVIKLKLEEGELSGLHVNDFCRGIFHNLTDNETSPGVDGSGFEVMVGFRTSYFTPVQILDNAHFRYELKPGSTVHPCASMKFAAYGNPIEKNRQASAYSTRTYTRYLRNVSTWEINPGKHVSMQLGDLSNLVINGESLAEGSVYLNNVYFGGNILTVGGLDNGLQGKDAYSVTLSTYSAVYNTSEELTELADVVSGDKSIMTGSNMVTASSFRISTRIQATKGEKPLRYSNIIGEGKYMASATGEGCLFAIADGMVIVHNVAAEKAVVKIEVNCEGLAVYEQEFTIVSVTDGIDGTDFEWIYKRTATEAEKPTMPATSQDDDFVPEGWTDDPVGTTLEMPYEWSCKREKKAGVWGEFSDVFLWLKFGKDGKEQEYIYKRTTNAVRPSTPATSQEDDFIPVSEGWTDDPVGPTSSYPYEWVSVRKKVKNVWGNFSLPALSAKYSFDGQDGADGRPGYDGSDGRDGIQGPGLNYRGDWSSTTTYNRNTNLVDVVSVRDSNDIPTYYLLLASSSRNQYPGSYPSVWQVQNSFKNVATDLLFANSATISKFQFDNFYIRSLNNAFCLNGQEKTDVPMLAMGSAAGQYGYDVTARKINENASLKLYQSGIITVGGGVAQSNAGISGVIGTPRIWAGDTYSNSWKAPFQVWQDGSVKANNCDLTGSFKTSSSGKKVRIAVDPTYGAELRIEDENSNSVISLKGPSSVSSAVINVGNISAFSAMTNRQIALSNNNGGVTIGLNADGSINLSATKWPTTWENQYNMAYVEGGVMKVRTP